MVVYIRYLTFITGTAVGCIFALRYNVVYRTLQAMSVYLWYLRIICIFLSILLTFSQAAALSSVWVSASDHVFSVLCALDVCADRLALPLWPSPEYLLRTTMSVNIRTVCIVIFNTKYPCIWGHSGIYKFVRIHKRYRAPVFFFNYFLAFGTHVEKYVSCRFVMLPFWRCHSVTLNF